MTITYNEIIDSLMMGESGKYLPVGLAHSLPIVGKYDNKIIDCFFIFSYSYGRGRFNSPIARLANDSTSKKLIYYYDNRDKPFETDHNSLSYPLDFKSSKDERRKALVKYQEYYIKVREFAFSQELNAEQKATLLEYMRLFSMLIAQSQKRFYIMLSLEFFEWMTKELKNNG
jgi:hypothetical protein